VTTSIPGVRQAYDASASAWAAGPDAAYGAMADVLIAAAPTVVAGARVLDLGTGTGAVARAARRAGAHEIVGVDLASAMIRAGSGWDAAVVADAAALPFAADSFDLVVAGCCLGHLPDPAAALAGARRLGPALAASAFQIGWTHPAKALVDGVAARFGFSAPAWYTRLKTQFEPEVDDPARLQVLARSAGYRRVEVSTHLVDAGLRTPQELTAWRLGMAHLAPFLATLAPFLATLEPARRDELRAQCHRELAQAPPLRVPLVVLAAACGP